MILANIKDRKIHSLWIFAAFWSLLLLVKFVPFVPQPESIIGYLWKYEFAIALFLSVFLIFFLKCHSLRKFLTFEKDEFYFIILPILAFTIWSFLSILWSQSIRHAIHHSLLWGTYLVFYLISRLVVKYSRLLNSSLQSLVIVVSIFGLCCAIEYFGYLAGSREVVISFTYSKFAEIGVLLLPIVLLFRFEKNDKLKLLWIFGTIALSLLIICSFARTQFISTIILLILSAISVFAFKLNSETRDRFLKSAAIVVVLAVSINLIVAYSSNAVSTVTRFTDKANAPSQQSMQVRPLFWGISLEMFRENPVFGVGADNFLIKYGDSRSKFVSSRIDEPQIGLMEDIVPERSHNEFLQILAELGIIGAVLFLWLLVGILKMSFYLWHSRSPLAFGSMIGLFSFLLCSIATSFSFRLPGNGLCFFFVLAIASAELFKSKERIDVRSLFPHAQPILIFASLTLCIAMVVFSGVRGASLFYVYASQTTTEDDEIERNITSAIGLDPNDCLANYQYGSFLVSQKRYKEASEHFRIAIDNGISISTAYFDLASNQILAGEPEKANATFNEAINVYPRSIFLRAIYAKFLEENKEFDKSNIQLDFANKLNDADAKSWWLLLSGDFTAVKVQEANATKTMDLQPLNGVYAVLDYQKEKMPTAKARR